MKLSKKLLIPAVLIGVMAIGTVYGAFLTYKAYVEIYGYKYPLGQIEIETKQMGDIEGLEAREDYVGEIRVYTYSDKAQLVLQLLQLSHIVTNFRSFTVKVCLPLDMVFVVDLTGSMMPYMDVVKAKLIELMWLIRGMHKCDVRVGVVGFKDYPDETISMGLTDNLVAVQTYIEGLVATTGGGEPQSHYLGFREALNLFEFEHPDPMSITHDTIVVFVSDAPPGEADSFEFAPGGVTQTSLMALEEAGVKVHAVLCGPDDPPESLIYRWYADCTGGHFVAPVWDPDYVWVDPWGFVHVGFWMPYRIVPVVTSNPTWIVKLTAVTPFDSFQLPRRSSPPTEKHCYYRFEIYVDFFAKAIPWHEWFTVELAAHLEKAEPKPEFPPPVLDIDLHPLIELYIDPAPPDTVPPGGTVYFNFCVAFWTTPMLLTLEVFDPDGNLVCYHEWDITGATSPYCGSASCTLPLDAKPGFYSVWLKYYSEEMPPGVPETSVARAFIVAS